MKTFVLTIIVFITYIIQTALIQNFNIAGVYPNLSVVVTCVTAFLFGSFAGGAVGLSLGLLQDMYQGSYIGLYGLAGLYLGIIIGQFNKRFFKDNYGVALILMILATVIYESVIYTFNIFIYEQVFDFSRIAIKMGLMISMNIVAALFIYPILMKINLGFEIDRNIFTYRNS